MSILIKLAALALLAILAVPILSGSSGVASLVGAIVEDASAFCERKPEACHQGAEIARDTHRFVASTLIQLEAHLDTPQEGTLTAADRAIAPPAPAGSDAEPPHT